MATPNEFEAACPACGPGIYVIEDGSRLRVGLTSDLSRFVRRQRRSVRIRHVLRLDGSATRTWRTLLRALQAEGHVTKECQFEAGAIRDAVAQVARVGHRGHHLTARDIRDLARRTDSVASTRLESSSSPSTPEARNMPPTFRQVLGEIGADE
jgi:hypothetical protein